MKKFLIIIPLILLAGCEYRYRYECQDPANWAKESCNNDVCKAEGECTSDILGFIPGEGSRIELGEQQKFNERESQSISNTDCAQPATASTFKPNKPKTFKPNKVDDSFKKMQSQEEFTESEEAFVRTPLIMESEQPLTMNTIVETEGHNKAAKFNKW